MKILVTVCGRGGSKGVRNKNLTPLGGKPLIAWTINQAKAWGKAHRIVCSTDSPEIAAAAKAAGADVPFMRPAELASDTAGKVPVIRHALQQCEADGTRYDIVIDLDVTSPIREPADLDRILAIYEKSKPDVVFSVVRARKNPYFNMVERAQDGSLSISKKLPGAVLRRQDAPAVFELNASIYVYEARGLAESKYSSVLQPRFDIYEMKDESAFDIDSEMDLQVVTAVMKAKGWIPA